MNETSKLSADKWKTIGRKTTKQNMKEDASIRENEKERKGGIEIKQPLE